VVLGGAKFLAQKMARVKPNQITGPMRKAGKFTGEGQLEKPKKKRQ
jgi:hypothetical protein